MKHWPWKDNMYGNRWPHTATPTQHQRAPTGPPPATHRHCGNGLPCDVGMVGGFLLPQLNECITSLRRLWKKKLGCSQQIKKKKKKVRLVGKTTRAQSPSKAAAPTHTTTAHQEHLLLSFLPSKTFGSNLRFNMIFFLKLVMEYLKICKRLNCTKLLTYLHCSRFLFQRCSFLLFSS